MSSISVTFGDQKLRAKPSSPMPGTEQRQNSAGETVVDSVRTTPKQDTSEERSQIHYHHARAPWPPSPPSSASDSSCSSFPSSSAIDSVNHRIYPLVHHIDSSETTDATFLFFNPGKRLRSGMDSMVRPAPCFAYPF
jgi:hypothetical protein